MYQHPRSGDPDRFEGAANDSVAVILSNFTDKSMSMSFAVHLICSLLVGTFRSTSDVFYCSPFKRNFMLMVST